MTGVEHNNKGGQDAVGMTGVEYTDTILTTKTKVLGSEWQAVERVQIHEQILRLHFEQ